MVEETIGEQKYPGLAGVGVGDDFETMSWSDLGCIETYEALVVSVYVWDWLSIKCNG